MLQFKSANGSRASRRWAKSGKTKTFPRGRRLKVYRASRWSAIGIIGDPAQKTVLDEAGFLMEAFTCAWRINRIRRLSEFGTSLDSASATGTNRDQLVTQLLPQAVPAGALPAPHAPDRRNSTYLWDLRVPGSLVLIVCVSPTAA